MRAAPTHSEILSGRFHQAQLLVKDFDGTVGLTDEQSPAGIGLNEVHENVIRDMFGPLALAGFISDGGVKSRSPREIVKTLAPDASEKDLLSLKNEFVKAKLDIFLGEIGTRFPSGEVWPRPVPGYIETMEKIELAKQDGRLIDDAIISSGHESFIVKTYKAWGVTRPKFLLADDTPALVELDIPDEQKIKPSPILMELVRRDWRYRYTYAWGSVPDAQEELSRIFYVGNDQTKDGGLAENCQVDFSWIDQKAYFESWQRVASKLHLGNIAIRQGA